MNNINYLYLLLIIIIFIIIYYIIALQKKQETFKDLKELKDAIDLDFLSKITKKINKLKETFDNDSDIIFKIKPPKARCSCCNENMHLYRK
tara:strand:- start:1666 stop:1938 length:273 start_codon:yes stop_codon:yes gene_type:complete